MYGFYRPHRAHPELGEVVNHKTGEVTRPVSRTKQSFVPECDINNIVKSYRVTGQINHMRSNAAQGVYEDLPDPIDFQTSLNIIQEARDSFQSLPAAVRRRFDNDPAEFLAFVTNPKNQDEIIKMGLAVDNRPPPPPPPAPEAPPPAAPEPPKAS
jgi:phage internal scaffolding protein